MIIFHKTKKVGTQSFMVFTNEAGSFVEIPADEKTVSLFIHHFERLSPGGVRKVEEKKEEESEGK